MALIVVKFEANRDGKVEQSTQVCDESGLPSVRFGNWQLVIASGRIKDREDTLTMQGIEYGVSAGHGIYLSSGRRIDGAIVDTKAPFIVLFHKDYGIAHSRM